MDILARFVETRLGHVHAQLAATDTLGALKKGGVRHGDTELTVGSTVVVGDRNRFFKALNFGRNTKAVLGFTRHRGIIRKDRERPPY